MSRKKILAIVLFLVIGLVSFTFAGTLNNNESEQIEDDNEIIDEGDNNTPTDEEGDTTALDLTEDEQDDTEEDDEENDNAPVDNAPVIEVVPTRVVIIEGTDYNVLTGVSVTDDFDTLTAAADITDTTNLSVSTHIINYTATDSSNNSANAQRSLVILSADGDEDEDGFTNKEEVDNNTDPEDEEDYPTVVLPTLSYITPITLEVGTEYNEDVTFTVDTHDTITTTVNITENVDTSVVGIYKVNYLLVDRWGNEVTGEKTVNVVDTTKPSIELLPESVVILKKSKHNVTKGFSYSDNYTEKDDLKVNISTTKTNKFALGENIVTYTVTDENGNVQTATRSYIVLSKNGDKDKDGFTNKEELNNGSDPLDETSIPKGYTETTITLLGENPLSVELGTEFNDPGYEVKMHKLDRKKYSKIAAKKIMQNGSEVSSIDTSNEGEYLITYTLNTRQGEKSIERKVIVEDTIAPVITVLESPFKITGKIFDFWKDSKISKTYLKDNYNNYITVDDSTATIDLTNIAYQKPYETNLNEVSEIDRTNSGKYFVTYTATDIYGNTSEKVVEIWVSEFFGTIIKKDIILKVYKDNKLYTRSTITMNSAEELPLITATAKDLINNEFGTDDIPSENISVTVPTIEKDEITGNYKVGTYEYIITARDWAGNTKTEKIKLVIK